MTAIMCRYCGHPIEGRHGGWWSLRTTFEVCEGDSPTSFHEPEPDFVDVSDEIATEYDGNPDVQAVVAQIRADSGRSDS